MKNRASGNISVLALVLVFLFAFLSFALGDICRIFVARETTKNAADAVALAVSQDILFFDTSDVFNTAKVIAEQNDCKLTDIEFSYDEVNATVEKKLDFMVLKGIYPDGCVVYSSSCSRVIFPWDEYFGFCESYKFDY